MAAFDEFPEAERWLDFAVNKFYAAYPVWSDDDGGWHEGLSYWAGYMVKVTWWMDLAQKSLGIDGFKKPFFAHVGDYALYTAPPGSPEMGFGDLSFRPPSSGWSFVRFFAARTGNPYWTWWADQWKIAPESGEPVLGFLWGAQKSAAPKPPAALPPSKVFRGIGVAILNTTLIDAADNVQVRFKSSPFGRQSHGHDPHNSFTLNAYGEPLLVNNVYRDLYGSPFHKDWCWSTKAQNALLVDGEGQKAHSRGPDGPHRGVRFPGRRRVRGRRSRGGLRGQAQALPAARALRQARPGGDRRRGGSREARHVPAHAACAAGVRSEPGAAATRGRARQGPACWWTTWRPSRCASGSGTATTRRRTTSISPR